MSRSVSGMVLIELMISMVLMLAAFAVTFGLLHYSLGLMLGSTKLANLNTKARALAVQMEHDLSLTNGHSVGIVKRNCATGESRDVLYFNGVADWTVEAAVDPRYQVPAWDRVIVYHGGTEPDTALFRQEFQVDPDQLGSYPWSGFALDQHATNLSGLSTRRLSPKLLSFSASTENARIFRIVSRLENEDRRQGSIGKTSTARLYEINLIVQAKNTYPLESP